MKLIVHNDDFGMTYGLTEAIKDCFINGLTTSTSIRTNGPAYKTCLKYLRNSMSKVGLGLHLNLTQGVPYSQQLQNIHGKYKYDFFGYLLNLISNNNQFIEDIEKELDQQFKIVIKDGLTIDHVSGHDHIHMIPSIFEIICKLCRKYHISKIRFPKERYYLTDSIKNNLLPFINSNIIKFGLLNELSKINCWMMNKYKLTTTDSFYGVLHTNNMNNLSFVAAVKSAIKNHDLSTEILLHPGFPNHQRDVGYIDGLAKHYANINQRRVEYNTLQSKEVKKFLKEQNVKLSTYREI